MQLSLLDYTPSLIPGPKVLASVRTVPDPKPDICPQRASLPIPFAIGDRVEGLPHPTPKPPGITTSFKGRTGIVVRVDRQRQRCWVHFGVANHPSIEYFEYLQKSDRLPHLWPTPLTATPLPVCWAEWVWWPDLGWRYTGTMGISIRHRRLNSELFPVGLDPNKLGVRP